MATTNGGSNGNGGDGSNGGGRRPGIPQPIKPRNESAKNKRRSALIAHIIANMDIPPFRNDQPRVTHVPVALGGAGPSTVSAIPTVADMMVDMAPPPPPLAVATAPPPPPLAVAAAEATAPPALAVATAVATTIVATAPPSPTVGPAPDAPAPPHEVMVTHFEAPRGAPFRVVSYPKVERSDGTPVVPPTTSMGVVRAAPQPPRQPAEDVERGEQVEKPDVDMDEVVPAEDGHAMVLSIVVRSYTLGDIGVMYNIRTDETFEAIYEDYASRIDVKANQIKLYLGATYVTSTEYPLAIGVQTGTVLYVQGEEGVVNTCTRFKRFYLKNTGHRKKIKLRVQGKLDTPLCRLFHIWGDRVNVDPTEVIFYHEDTMLCTLNTIREAEVKNGDKVVVAPNSQP